MSLTHIAVSYLLWVFNTLPPLSSLGHKDRKIFLLMFAQLLSKRIDVDGTLSSGVIRSFLHHTRQTNISEIVRVLGQFP